MSLTLIEKLYAQSFRTSSGIPTSEMNTITSEDIIFVPEKFAELIVRECITECLQEWYELNAESVADDDPFRDPRATGIRVGQKNGILKCISKIKQHFGVE